MGIVLFKTYRHSLFIGIIFLMFVSCSSKKILSSGKVDVSLPAKAIIKQHYNTAMEFNTLSGRIKVDYSDGSASQGVSLSLRMQKDEAIWLSAPLGMVKVYITPERVSFYNRLQNEFFDGDFSYLSTLLGTELDFANLQNLLLGQALMDLRKERYAMEVTDNTYLLKPKKPIELFKILFQIEPKYFKISSQRLSQPIENRLLEIDYRNYQELNGQILPNTINITATQADKKNTIAIEYRSIELNKSIKFPYKIPKGFKEVVLE